jgi:uncharacterized protein YndB with AHSA1/START domain
MIIILLIVLIAALLIFAATRPDTFRVQRRISIKAPPEKVFALINDFRNWVLWSPWEKMDPSMKKAHSGATVGKGAVYEWEGNRKVGKGRMEIIESSPSSRIMIQLDFIKPIEGHNMTEFSLKAERGFTIVTWAMYGSNPYMAKLTGLFFDMSNMIGKDFETGLSGMKTAAENQIQVKETVAA